jgi:hypothetical protein
MKSNAKRRGEDKVGKQGINPERSRRVVHGSSNISPADIIFQSDLEITEQLRILARAQRPLTEQSRVNHDIVLKKLGIKQKSEFVESVKQTTEDEGKGESVKQTPGDIDEESESTTPISKTAENDIKIGKIMDLFEPSEYDNDDDVSSQEDYSKIKPAPSKGPVKHQLVNAQKNFEEHKKMLQEQKEMLLNTEVALTRTQGDKDKLLKEVRVVARDNRRALDLADKERSDRIKAENDKTRFVI